MDQVAFRWGFEVLATWISAADRWLHLIAPTPKLARKALFAALYYSEGAPIGFVWVALPALLAARGVATAQITQLSAVLVLPWALKFLWAPLVDRCQTERWTLKHWIATAQLVMGLLLLPIANLDFVADFDLLRWLLLAHALAAATQDVAIDAYCLKTVPTAERGGVNGWMQAGMLLGTALLGGGALLAESALGQPLMVLLLVGNCWLSLPLLWWAPSPAHIAEAGQVSTTPLWAQIKTVLGNRRIWWTLAFAMTAGAAYEAAGAMVSPTLKGFAASQQDIGHFFLFARTSSMAIGALFGGWLADRWTHGKTLLLTQSLMILTVVALAATAAGVESQLTDTPEVPPSLTLTWIVLSGMYLAIGAFTAASYTLFMDVSRPPLAATRLSLLMAGTNLCESWTAWQIGTWVSHHGFALSTLAMCIPSLLAMLLLVPILRSRDTLTADMDSEEDQ